MKLESINSEYPIIYKSYDSFSGCRFSLLKSEISWFEFDQIDRVIISLRIFQKKIQENISATITIFEC